MIKKNYKNFLSLSLVLILGTPFQVLADTSDKKLDIDITELAFPAEVKELSKKSGSVFYSTTSKNKPLMPIHFWGEVGNPGLHYVPVDSKLIKGISMAGGGSGSARLDEVSVTRAFDGKISRLKFDLDDGGDSSVHDFTLRPNDTVFIKKDHYRQDRAYYTGLVQVLATILTSVFIYKRIEEMDRN